jgi:hypothetical protein
MLFDDEQLKQALQSLELIIKMPGFSTFFSSERITKMFQLIGNEATDLQVKTGVTEALLQICQQ